MPPGFNRWLIPPAALMVHLSIGEIYAFSVFKNPLVERFGSGLTPVAIIFSISIMMLGLSAAVFGTWVGRAARGDVYGGALLVVRVRCRGPWHRHHAAVARLSRLRPHRRYRAWYRVHLARIHPDQMVP